MTLAAKTLTLEDLADIGELLVRNPAADLEQIRLAAQPYDRDGNLELLIAEASLRAIAAQMAPAVHG